MDILLCLKCVISSYGTFYFSRFGSVIFVCLLDINRDPEAIDKFTYMKVFEKLW